MNEVAQFFTISFMHGLTGLFKKLKDSKECIYA